ncbi:cysteine hydrolase family protein [Gluconobacter kanchanaburiensis]|uniref:Isochorismatase n=1 Tax=Gluconobacter kanchanaburiensis NBRC 103587 TaxID=1307948 RepID=A0A511B9T0_9PROT|nr:isochorismatase family cysteine hydrolase [Gluconobacter kanchanaburiensis]MBF0862398.1 cysteine hydrolase [Gluconobacter kanchanaburiensis]GEK96481.1 isochorismatase [Gluconobacter kanchanaburiensis NBRC 103587]
MTPRDSRFQPGRTTLLLVDMQTVWMRSPTGAAEDYFTVRNTHVAVPNQVRLLRTARALGIDVLHTIIRSLRSDGRDRSLDHKLTPIHIAPDDPDGDIIPELAPCRDEIVLPKTSSGVFNSTNIDYILRNLGTDHLIIAGQLTDQCVDMAVRDAADRGYRVLLPEDACSTYSAERHAAALSAFGGYCTLTDTENVLRRMREISSHA